MLGSVGPSGELLEPLGPVKPEDLRASLQVQIEALLDGGADGILLETMTALDEIAIALTVARELQAPVVIVTAAFDPTRSGPRTMMGVRPEQRLSSAHRTHEIRRLAAADAAAERGAT